MNDETRPSLREEMDEIKSKLTSAQFSITMLIERINTLENTVEDLIKETTYP